MQGEIYDSTLFNDANCKAIWRLENVNDSKNSYNLTNNGSISFAAAKYNNGADLGASNTTKYLSISSDIGLTWMGAKTIGGWIKLNTEISSGTYSIIDLITGDGNTGETYISYNYNSGTRQLVYSRYNNGGTGVSTPITSNQTLGTSNWHLIALTYSGSSLIGYLDGSSIGSISSGNSSGVGTYSTDGFTLGAASGGGNKSSAILDDWSVFDRVLTPTEISQWYAGTLKTRFPSSSGFFALLGGL